MTIAASVRAEAPPRALFLLIGQSNMAGRAPVWAEDRKPIDGVVSLDAEGNWRPAIDPLHADRADYVGVGMGRSFARVLREVNPDREIGLIPCAVGGTRLDQWEPGGELFNRAINRARQAMASGELVGILWHQGEGDTRTWRQASTYAARWKVMAKAFRAELAAPEVPMVVGELGEFLFRERYATAPFLYYDEVNRQLRSLAEEMPLVGCARSRGLSDMGDQLHFSTDSQRELGRRYAMIFLQLQPSWADRAHSEKPNP